MSPERQKKIDISKKVFENISGYGLVVTLCTYLIIRFIIIILGKFDIDVESWSSYDSLARVYEIISLIIIVVSIASFLAAAVLSEWATDEEKEKKKTEIKEAVREIKEEDKARNKVKAAIQKEVESPLRGLTDQQNQVVLDVLMDIPVNDKGFIANAELMGLIHALDADDNLKKNVELEDVIAWVEYIRFPDKVDAAHFKSEYSYRPSKTTITKMGDRVRKGFDKLTNLR